MYGRLPWASTAAHTNLGGGNAASGGSGGAATTGGVSGAGSFSFFGILRSRAGGGADSGAKRFEVAAPMLEKALLSAVSPPSSSMEKESAPAPVAGFGLRFFDADPAEAAAGAAVGGATDAAGEPQKTRLAMVLRSPGWPFAAHP